MIQLKSRWCGSVGPDNALPEYPRPNLVRSSYLSLNGTWQYAINRTPEVSGYDGDILVPFSPETLLSGVNQVVTPQDFLHYRKVFTLPRGFRQDRVLLHFGAVDQECAVFLNGQALGSHKGGYNPFTFDITDALTDGENELTLTVRDWTEEKPHARGKQLRVKKGILTSIFYTPQSGIWKSVWLESVPQDYIESIRITALFDDQAIRLQLNTRGREASAQVAVLDGQRLVTVAEVTVNQEQVIPLGECRPWSPEAPHLYDLKIRYGADTVSSYFGMRKFHVAKDPKGILRFFLNNRPIFFNGVLDQGYWPESLLTPPSDEALLWDIQKLKDLGYNTIRKHIKVEPERFYYHCDRVGMLVWQDMPNGGGVYNMIFQAGLPNKCYPLVRYLKDSNYRLFRRQDEEGRKQYYEDLQTMVTQLYNHPCIAAWVPFNEGWGQFDANKATALVRRLDGTRFINEACGWFDQRGGDMYSIHNYSKGLKIQAQPDRVVALTEFGGYALPIPGHLACEKEFGYQAYRSREELTAAYRKLWEEEIYPNVEKGLSSAIYTQTSDIEEEINGLFTYDRQESKFLEADLRETHRKLYEIFAENTK